MRSINSSMIMILACAGCGGTYKHVVSVSGLEKPAEHISRIGERHDPLRLDPIREDQREIARLKAENEALKAGRAAEVPKTPSQTEQITSANVIRESEDGFAASVPGLPGCHSQGATEKEALENIAIAIQGWLEADIGLPEGAIVREVEVPVRLTLESMLDGVNESNLHEEQDTGPPAGREIW